MRDWKTKKLDELGSVGRGRSRHRPRNDPILYGGAYPFFQTGDVREAEFYLRHHSQTYNEVGLGQSKLWQPGTLCITIAANIAETAILDVAGCFPDSVVGFISDPNQSDVRFVKYLLDFTKGRMQIISKGTTQDNLSLEKMLSINFSVPDVGEQRRIAELLVAFDDLIDNNSRRIAILEELVRGIFEEWIVRFRAPGCEGLPLVGSSIGPIPQGWTVKTLGELIAGHIGGGWGKEAPDEDHDAPSWVIRGTDIPEALSSQVGRVPYRYHSSANLKSRKLQAGDIVFEVSGGSKGQPVGRTLLVTSQLLSAFGNDAVMCASFCKRIQPNTAIYGSELLYLSFREGYETGEIERFQVQSTGISNFKWTEYLQEVERAVPPEALLSLFRQTVVPIFSMISVLGLQIANLRSQRDFLLPKLISGAIDVSRAERVMEAAE